MHFTTFVNILPKLRYFEGRYDIQIGYKNNQYFCFPDRPMKGGDILDIPRKEGGILKKEGYDPPYQLWKQHWELKQLPNSSREDISVREETIHFNFILKLVQPICINQVKLEPYLSFDKTTKSKSQVAYLVHCRN